MPVSEKLEVMSGVAYRKAVDHLYRLYKTKGFVTVDSVMDMLSGVDARLSDVEHICDQLLSMGVIIRDEPNNSRDQEDNEDDYDRSRTNYEQLYIDAITIDEQLAEFIEHVRLIQPPQHREWRTLLPQAKAGNLYAYHRITEMYLRTVVKLSLWFHQRLGLQLAETIQEGCIGLMIAIAKFDSSKGDVFPTYYPLWVRQRVQREVPFAINPTVYYPVHVKNKLFSVWDAVINHECCKCKPYDMCPNLISTISGMLDCTEEHAVMYLAYFEQFLSLDHLNLENPKQLSDHGCVIENLTDNLCRAEMKRAITEALSTLTSRESCVIQLRFGLGGNPAHTLEQVGTAFGVTRERIRQIEARAIRKLQHPSRSKRLKSFWD